MDIYVFICDFIYVYHVYIYIGKKYRKIWKHSNPEGLKTSSPVGRCLYHATLGR